MCIRDRLKGVLTNMPRTPRAPALLVSSTMARRGVGVLWAVLLAADESNAVSAVSRPTRPNVLYMVADDLRIELPTYGAAHVYAPALTQLASESLVFDAAYCNQPVRPDCFLVPAYVWMLELTIC